MWWISHRRISSANSSSLHQRIQARRFEVSVLLHIHISATLLILCNVETCLLSSQNRYFRIRLGEWDVNNDSEFYSHVEFDATQIFIHPDFYPGNLYNDIAMIRINGFVDYTRNPHITPVCLPDRFKVRNSSLLCVYNLINM